MDTNINDRINRQFSCIASVELDLPEQQHTTRLLRALQYDRANLSGNTREGFLSYFSYTLSGVLSLYNSGGARHVNKIDSDSHRLFATFLEHAKTLGIKLPETQEVVNRYTSPKSGL